MLNVENMEYNTTRNHLIVREYGRHIQKMVEYVKTIEDEEKRQRNAMALIELMGFLNPHLKNVEDFRHKLWDHLFLISDFELDVKSPYPIPTRETLRAKPDVLGYPKRYPRYNHLGKNIEIVIDKALEEENPEKRQGFANAIAYYMKLTYSNWHKELVHDDNIQSELQTITDGQLEFNNRPFVKHRVDNRPDDDYRSNSGGGYRKNFGQRNNNNNSGGNNNRNNNNGNRGNNNNGGNRSNGNNGNSGGNNNNRNFKKRY
ncbi:MAG TPA: DUF4290 domain-containing protein [Ferruginibacter sp.]|jgi:hypothetical protein|nr:DUF4290 domain-containing protein [Ferruginibacter sp.]